MTRADIIELMAQAFYEDNYGGGLGTKFPIWHDLPHSQKYLLCRCSDTALTALEAAGVRLVPEEPTWSILLAGWGPGVRGAQKCYTAMLAASPYEGEERK